MTTLADLLAERALHWRRTRRVTALLLALWFCTTFLAVFFARELSAFTVFGWPLSFYLAAQGAALVYLAVIGVYALLMARIDRRFADALKDDA
jgi:putative solute:sodium symporter small subunit